MSEKQNTEEKIDIWRGMVDALEDKTAKIMRLPVAVVAYPKKWFAAKGSQEEKAAIEIIERDSENADKAAKFLFHPIDSSMKVPAAREFLASAEPGMVIFYIPEKVIEPNTGETLGFKLKDPNSDKYADLKDGKPMLNFKSLRELYDHRTDVENTHQLKLNDAPMPYRSRLTNLYNDAKAGNTPQILTGISSLISASGDAVKEFIGSKWSTVGIGLLIATVGGGIASFVGSIAKYVVPGGGLTTGAITASIAGLGLAIAASPFIPGLSGIGGKLIGIEPDSEKTKDKNSIAPALQPKLQAPAKASSIEEIPTPEVTLPNGTENTSTQSVSATIAVVSSASEKASEYHKNLTLRQSRARADVSANVFPDKSFVQMVTSPTRQLAQEESKTIVSR